MTHDNYIKSWMYSYFLYKNKEENMAKNISNAFISSLSGPKSHIILMYYCRIIDKLKCQGFPLHMLFCYWFIWERSEAVYCLQVGTCLLRFTSLGDSWLPVSGRLRADGATRQITACHPAALGRSNTFKSPDYNPVDNLSHWCILTQDNN